MKFDEIKELMRLFGKSKLDRIQIKQKDFEIEMEKGGETVVVEAAPSAQVQATPAPAAIPASSGSNAAEAAPAPEAKKGELITSPMVGTFYASPSPDSPPFVKVGDTVRKGQTLCILEAMKIMNELEAEFDCKILEVLVEDGEPVEYDKPLFRVERL
ncbi:acetyl-CoA carboxylase biotin carboxyl carrier protein [Nitratifractor salsuginis]|uniref:Biotin carboxyl carrier protein of acetyl-CoA carboxylase n=1 Tax=Nitratifractor salsuginis (strain DSM 16511 / JCM 12458 / E9I37-1) TaxID=749222 RepID=E6X2W0_NITSE|nr:acetyl-CoA carboxylase biotin carboxyl carrier protein [Nitratifractor salsuginis]ADV47243.1 biotin carboxyl carrier protein [Nitratifractor salsuginis DSM 16511]